MDCKLEEMDFSDEDYEERLNRRNNHILIGISIGAGAVICGGWGMGLYNR